MIPIPGLAINLMPIIYAAVVAAGIAGLWWVGDKIGDAREAKVWALVNAAIAKKNVDVRHFNDADSKIAAVAEAARIRALEEARQIAVDQPVPDCKATEAQARALSKIR